MKKTKDIGHKVAAEINGLQIIRSEVKTFDTWTGEAEGQTKVFYDVCEGVELLESFKTLREAKRFCMNY